MNYYVKGYSNTGFNAVNIPSSPSVLKSLTSKTFPAIQVLQNLDLSTIRIKATWGQAKNLDYIELLTSDTEFEVGTYYIVTNVSMQATDVAELSVVCDYWNTAGGAPVLTPLDGITNRVHVSNDQAGINWLPSNDKGIYVNEDPLMTPSDNLYLETIWVRFGDNSYDTYIETTVD